MSTSEDHEGLANELERESDALKRENDKLGQDIADARDDWESKRNDPSIPGAPPPSDHDDEDDGQRSSSEQDSESESEDG
jgi:hypothetical protein